MLCRGEVQQKHGRNTADAAGTRADTVDTAAAINYRGGRTTGPKRSAVNGQVDLADLVCSTKEGRDDRTMPRWVQRQASAPV